LLCSIVATAPPTSGRMGTAAYNCYTERKKTKRQVKKVDIPAVVAGGGEKGGGAYSNIIKRGPLPVYSFYIPSGSVRGEMVTGIGGHAKGEGSYTLWLGLEKCRV
jgi:hypothetical protein